MGGVGSVAGFYVYVLYLTHFPDVSLTTAPVSRGNVDLPRYFPFLGSEQLEVLSVIASLLVLGTHGLTAWGVKERVLVGEP